MEEQRFFLVCYKEDPYCVMCSDCEMFYIPYEVETTIDELRLAYQSAIQDIESLSAYFRAAGREYEPMPNDFTGWLQRMVRVGAIVIR